MPSTTPSTGRSAATNAARIIDAFFDLADTIITVRSCLIRQARTTHR
jgi:hypothetical protein